MYQEKNLNEACKTAELFFMETAGTQYIGYLYNKSGRFITKVDSIMNSVFK